MEEIDLQECINTLLKHKITIIGIFLTAVLISGVLSYLVLNPVYQSQALIKLGNNSGSYSNPQVAKDMLSSSRYLQEINQELDLDLSAAELNSLKENNLTVEKRGNNLIKITYNSKEARESKAVVSKLIELFSADSLAKFKEEKEVVAENLAGVKAEIKDLETQIQETTNQFNNLKKLDLSTSDRIILNNNLTNKLQMMKSSKRSLVEKKYELRNKINSMESVTVVNQPIKPETPIKPNKKLNLAIAGVLGLMIGVFIAFIMEFWQDNNKEME
ncbi:YveK family protein [Halanaerobaculum tunisiense]